VVKSHDDPGHYRQSPFLFQIQPRSRELVLDWPRPLRLANFPSYEDTDGSAYLLSPLDGVSATYKAWANEYYERDVPIAAVEAVYQHQLLTDELVFALNPNRSLKLFGPEISEIGYPV
jgi:hypothetical protein